MKAAFSLIELLVVIAIAGVLAAVTLPAFNSIIQGSNVTAAGQMLASEIETGRQLAAVRNKTVEVRLMAKNGETAYSAVQLWWPSAIAQPATPASKPLALPQSIEVVSSMSPWVATLDTDTMTTGPYGNYSVFRIRASGAVEPEMTSGTKADLYMTVARGGKNAPDNFATIQINPDTARTLLYRP